jgi:hypothetical protein
MMYVHWREREHEELDILVEEDPMDISSLKQCGLWKFFQFPFMRAQSRLLNTLLEYWHPNVEYFMLEGQSLISTTEVIYFLTSLSRRGQPINLRIFPSRRSTLRIISTCIVRLVLRKWVLKFQFTRSPVSLYE